MKPPVARVWFDRSPLVPEIKMLGWESSTRAMPRLGEHVHPEAWEICYIVHGMVDWWVEDSVHEVRGGEVYITRPAERHGGVDAMMHPSELYWIHVELPKGNSAATGLTVGQTRRLRGDLANIRRRTFRVGAAIPAAFSELMSIHRRLEDPYAKVIAHGALMRLLIGVLRDHATASGNVGNAGNALANARVERALAWMNANLAEDFSVEQAASEAGVSVSRFHEIFVEQTGLTPNEYRTRQRVRKARERLRDPEVSITRLAMELGFSTSQYFATVFKSVAGMTPREYQRGRWKV